MKKKLKLISVLFLMGLMMTGCFKRDSLEGIEIVTTVYPIEFITNALYGKHAVVNSIYPDGIDTNQYTLNKKQIEDYSKKDLFIYNGLSNNKDIAISFLEKNRNMLIIDSSFGMETNYGIEELWLNPSHLLMMTQNIRNGLKEYITNSYLEKEIDKSYETLKVKLSELDAEIKITAENAAKKTIIVNSDVLRYLEKYGFKVISLDDTTTPVSQKTIDDVTIMIREKQTNHVFFLENSKKSAAWEKVVTDTSVTVEIFRKLDSITDTERDNKEDYLTIMNHNIELLRNELYE